MRTGSCALAPEPKRLAPEDRRVEVERDRDQRRHDQHGLDAAEALDFVHRQRPAQQPDDDQRAGQRRRRGDRDRPQARPQRGARRAALGVGERARDGDDRADGEQDGAGQRDDLAREQVVVCRIAGQHQHQVGAEHPRDEPPRGGDAERREQQQETGRNGQRRDDDDDRVVDPARERADRGGPAELEALRLEALGDLLDHLDVSRLGRQVALSVQVGPQVDDAHVTLAHPEQVARNDRPQVELVLFRLRDGLDAGGLRDDALREPLVALLHLGLVVGLDRAEVEFRALERVGRVVEVVGEAEDLVAQPEEDDGADPLAVAERVEQRVDLRRAEALVVLQARVEQQVRAVRERQRPGG